MSKIGFDTGDAFLDYWLSLPRDNASGLPEKASFDPAAITPILPHVFVAHSQARDDYRVSLRGTWLEEFVGRQNPAENVFDFYSGDDRTNYEKFIDTVLNRPAIGVIERSIQIPDMREYEFPSLFCPFLDENLNPTVMIGVALMEGSKTWEVDNARELMKNIQFRGFRLLDIEDIS